MRTWRHVYRNHCRKWSFTGIPTFLSVYFPSQPLCSFALLVSVVRSLPSQCMPSSPFFCSCLHPPSRSRLHLLSFGWVYCQRLGMHPRALQFVKQRYLLSTLFFFFFLVCQTASREQTGAEKQPSVYLPQELQIFEHEGFGEVLLAKSCLR